MNVSGLDFSKIYKVIDHELDQFIIAKFSGKLEEEETGYDPYECPYCDFYITNMDGDWEDGNEFIFKTDTWISTNDREIVYANDEEVEWLLLCKEVGRSLGIEAFREIKLNKILGK